MKHEMDQIIVRVPLSEEEAKDFFKIGFDLGLNPNQLLKKFVQDVISPDTNEEGAPLKQWLTSLESHTAPEGTFSRYLSITQELETYEALRMLRGDLGILYANRNVGLAYQHLQGNLNSSLDGRKNYRYLQFCTWAVDEWIRCLYEDYSCSLSDEELKQARSQEEEERIIDQWEWRPLYCTNIFEIAKDIKEFIDNVYTKHQNSSFTELKLFFAMELTGKLEQ